MNLNKYTLVARVFPTILSSIPIFILLHYLLSAEIKTLLGTVSYLEISGNVTIQLIVLYLLTQTSRFLGKEVFENLYFHNETSMPTTEFLLYSDNTYSLEYKNRIRELAVNKFQLRPPNEEGEKNNIEEARKQLGEIVALIRHSVGNGKLLLQHNTEYGFIRNLIGGSLFGYIFGAINIYYFLKISPNHTAYILSLVLTIAYLLILILSRFLIFRFGEIYAKRLYTEFIGESVS
jgi:hypothetical protein